MFPFVLTLYFRDVIMNLDIGVFCCCWHF